jgi:urea carboxylase
MRGYLLFAGGLDIAPYLGSRATFELGQFGGHAARRLVAGDVLHLGDATAEAPLESTGLPAMGTEWTLRVLYGPHGAPDFFTPEDIAMVVNADWQVHYNSNRTGVRLIGPKPNGRARTGRGGPAPSNIHDNPYAIGAVDFTGDMPIILGPDGPSLGGFVCPFVVIAADRGRSASSCPATACASCRSTSPMRKAADAGPALLSSGDVPVSTPRARWRRFPVLRKFRDGGPPAHGLSPAGRPQHPGRIWPDRARYRAAHSRPCPDDRAGALALPGVIDIVPGIRSLQLHFDGLLIRQPPWPR